MPTFRNFFKTSGLLLAAPVPLALALTYATGGWIGMLLAVGGIIAAALLYWWPIGAFLSWYQGRTWARWVLGYLISVPLYFLTLWILYPAWGGAQFHPFRVDRFFIYLSATPQFYFMVRISHYLVKRTPKRMMQGAAAALALGILLPGYLLATASPSWPHQSSDRVAIANSRIVDAASNRVIEGQTVYIQTGRIAEIGDAAAHPDWPRIDARGGYLIPGLIDVHTHIQSPIEVTSGFNLKYFAESLMGEYAPQRRAYLAAGVTSIRDLGGAAVDAFRLRDEIARKKSLGPRMFAVGRLVTSPKGHPVSTIWPESVARAGAILAKDEASMLDGLDRNLEGRPDAIKFVHGTIGRAKEELSGDLLARGIAWSTQRGLISVVHAETAEEVEDAIRAGATGVEHTTYLQSVPPALAALVSERRPFLDPTFGEFLTDLGMRGGSQAEHDACLARSYQAVRELARAGAKLVIGTDAPMVPYGAGLHGELEHFTRAGFKPAEVLTFATENNAAYLGKASELGRIATGYRADLIIVRENPLENLSTLRHPLWTMLDGQIVAGREP